MSEQPNQPMERTLVAAHRRVRPTMLYDLELIHQLCQEIGFSSVVESNELLKIQLSSAMVLCFQNSEKDEDCLVGFEGTPWHTHDDVIISNAQGMFTELSYLDIISGLGDGQVLICERLLQAKVLDRWLIHRESPHDF